MSYTVYLDYGDGWVDLTNYSGKNLVRYNGFQKIQQIHDEDCKIARNSARFQIDSDINLIPHLMNVEEIKVQIEKDGVLWFKGYARPVTTFTASVDGDVIDFEAFDSSWLLERSIQGDVKYINQYLCNTSDTENSIIHDLFSRAGIASGDVNITVDILQQITVTFEEGTKYIDAIGDILWDYHHVLDVSDDGKLYVYDWAPETIPAASHTFEENNTVRQIEISKNDIDEDQVRVHYHELIEKTGITLCKKTYSDVTTPTVFKVLTTDVCYEWNGSEEYASVEDNESAKNWPSIPGRFKFENPVEDSEWLNTSNHAVSWTNERFWNSVFIGIGAGGKTDNNEVSLVSSAFGVSYADLQFYIQSPDKPWYSSASWNTMRKVVVTGDAQLLKRHANKTNLIPTTGNTVKEYKANYIYDGIIAVALATAMAHHLEYGRWIYKWQSEDEVDIGDYVRIYNTTSLNVDTIVRVIKKSWNEVKKIFDYKAIGVTDLGTPVGSVISGTYAVVPPGDVIDAVDRVNEGLDDLGNIKKVIKGSALNTEGEESIRGVSGLYFTAEFIGFYNGDEGVDDWTARIKDDGTFKFLGNADNFIEWDGSKLHIEGDMFLSGDSEIRGSVAVGEVLAVAGSVTVGTGVTISGSGAGSITVGTAVVLDGDDTSTIGGWAIGPTSIISDNGRFAIRSDAMAQEIRDAAGELRIITGWMGNAPAGWLNADGKQLDETDYGQYISGGNYVVADGARFENGDYKIQHDAAYIVYSPMGVEIERLGSLGAGDVGLDIGGMKFASQLTGGGGSDDTFEDTLSGGGGSTAAMDALLGGGQSLYGAKGLLYSMNDGRLYLAGDAVIDGTITTPKLAAQAVTAVKIDVADLFAQDITFTNAIQSDGFVSGSGGHGVKLDAINDTYEFHGSIYADSGVFSGVLDAASGSFGSFGPSTGIEIKDGAIIFTDDNIFGGTSKGVIEQGSLGNIGITAESAVVLKTTNGPSVQINLFNKFLPSTGLLLGDSGNPWEEGYVKKMYIQDELRLGSTTWSGMPAVQGFSFFSIHTENNVFDALSPFLAVGEKKGCVGYYDGAEVAYIHRGSQTTIDIYTAGGTMRRRFTDGSSTSVGTFAVMLVV